MIEMEDGKMNGGKVKEEGSPSPSFFKFLADDSVDSLPICPAFVKKYLSKGKYPKNPIIIETEYSEESWGVEIVRKGGKHCFVNGWLEFMKDNELKMGDFLVFWRVADSTFQVNMYGPSCCEKRRNPIPAGWNIEKKKHKKKKKKKPMIMCRRVMMKSHKYYVPVTKRLISEMEMEMEMEGRGGGCSSSSRRKKKTVLVMRDEEEREWQVGVSKRNSGYYLTRGWYYFQRANKVQVGDTCLFTFLTPHSLRVQVLRKPKTTSSNYH